MEVNSKRQINQSGNYLAFFHRKVGLGFAGDIINEMKINMVFSHILSFVCIANIMEIICHRKKML